MLCVLLTRSLNHLQSPERRCQTCWTPWAAVQCLSSCHQQELLEGTAILRQNPLRACYCYQLTRCETDHKTTPMSVPLIVCWRHSTTISNLIIRRCEYRFSNQRIYPVAIWMRQFPKRTQRRMKNTDCVKVGFPFPRGTLLGTDPTSHTGTCQRNVDTVLTWVCKGKKSVGFFFFFFSYKYFVYSLGNGKFLIMHHCLT